jgi:1-phosphofructokinase
LSAATGLVCAGSLPAGLPTAWYGEVVELARRRSVFVAVDSSGAPLADSLSAKPDLVKPNVHELAELTGRLPRTLGDVIDAAQEVRNRGAGAVLASLGADGAALVDGDGALWGHAPVDRVVSTVGAGDAMLAGYLSCRLSRTDALATALQWGAAAVAHEGTLFSPSAFGIPATVTNDIDPKRPLHDSESISDASTHRKVSLR